MAPEAKLMTERRSYSGYNYLSGEVNSIRNLLSIIFFSIFSIVSICPQNLGPNQIIDFCVFRILIRENFLIDILNYCKHYFLTVFLGISTTAVNPATSDTITATVHRPTHHDCPPIGKVTSD